MLKRMWLLILTLGISIFLLFGCTQTINELAKSSDNVTTSHDQKQVQSTSTVSIREPSFETINYWTNPFDDTKWISKSTAGKRALGITDGERAFFMRADTWKSGLTPRYIYQSDVNLSGVKSIVFDWTACDEHVSGGAKAVIKFNNTVLWEHDIWEGNKEYDYKLHKDETIDVSSINGSGRLTLVLDTSNDWAEVIFDNFRTMSDSNGDDDGDDCHKGSPGDFDYCSEDCQCDVGKGDCDNDNQCQAGLHCEENIGENYGWDGWVDVCEGGGDETPILKVTPTSHDFGDLGRGETATWSFKIKNTGGGKLNWNVTENLDWITVNPTSGSTTTETDAVTIKLNTSGLRRGKNYDGDIEINSNDGSAKVYVQVTIIYETDTIIFNSRHDSSDYWSGGPSEHWTVKLSVSNSVPPNAFAKSSLIIEIESNEPDTTTPFNENDIIGIGSGAVQLAVPESFDIDYSNISISWVNEDNSAYIVSKSDDCGGWDIIISSLVGLVPVAGSMINDAVALRQFYDCITDKDPTKGTVFSFHNTYDIVTAPWDVPNVADPGELPTEGIGKAVKIVIPILQTKEEVHSQSTTQATAIALHVNLHKSKNGSFEMVKDLSHQ